MSEPPEFDRLTLTMPAVVKFVTETSALFGLVDIVTIEAGFAVAVIERAAPPALLSFSCPCEREVKAKNDNRRMTR